ncbi:MAG: hypothetical protein AAF689_05475 [Pseudomonadota bacterium]
MIRFFLAELSRYWKNRHSAIMFAVAIMGSYIAAVWMYHIFGWGEDGSMSIFGSTAWLGRWIAPPALIAVLIQDYVSHRDDFDE